MRKEAEGIARMSHGRTFLFGLWVIGHMMGDRKGDPTSQTPARFPPDVMSRSKTSAGGSESENLSLR
jgi:hypothetical protein